MVYWMRKELIAMQMKEICERTGLTDRAVRLYIESGLLSPAIESNYAGRRTIRFTEQDADILAAIAALRQAEFSIADIREMQMQPDRIPAIVGEHRRNLQESADAKLRTLKRLEELDCTSSLQYTDVAAHLTQANDSASIPSIPKEDSLMRLKDLQSLIRHRIPSVIGFALFLIGAIMLLPLTVKAAFAEPLILVGGGYRLEYAFTGEAFMKNLLLFLMPVLLLLGAVLLFLHILHGKRPLVIAAGIVCVLTLLIMILLPEELRQNLYLYEFLRCRYSILWSVLPGTSAFTDAVITSLKLIAPIGSLICCAAGWFSQRKAD